MLVQTPNSAKLSQFLSSGAVMTACHLAVTLQLHSPAFAELQSCNNSGYHILWLSGCCWWHGLPHVMHCSWSREKQISIPRLSIYPNCMIDGRHCNLCYLDMVAGGSQCSDYYPGGSLLPDSDNDGLWMSTQLVTVVTMTNLHCSRYMILCQTLGYKYFVIVGFPVIRFPQRAK